MKIYLPNEINSTQCVSIYDKDIIRVYDEEPTLNNEVEYTDYYINSHYINQKGKTIISDTIPTCIDNENLTTSYYYRNDFDQILTIFFIMIFIVYFISSRIIKVFFLGFRG